MFPLTRWERGTGQKQIMRLPDMTSDRVEASLSLLGEEPLLEFYRMGFTRILG